MRPADAAMQVQTFSISNQKGPSIEGPFLIGSGGRISPSALRASVGLAAFADASASGPLRLNLLPTQNHILPRDSKNEKAGPRGTGSFHFGSGGPLCTLAMPSPPALTLQIPLKAIADGDVSAR